MPSTFKIKLLSLELQATREPKPYHDRIVTSLVVSIGGKPLTSPDIPAGQVGKHAYCGFAGSGSVLDYTAFALNWGGNWGHPLEFEFVLQDNAPSTSVDIIVHVANMRGLPDKIIEKALLSMGVAAATSIAALPAEGLSSAAKLAATLAAAVGGEGLKELIQGFALEVPKCRGTVYTAGIDLQSEDLYGKPYETTVMPDGEVKGRFIDSRWSDPIHDVPAEGCGQPKALLTYAIEKTAQFGFRDAAPVKFGRHAATRAPISAWLGQWSDSPWNLSRVFVVIERGTAAGADVLKITIREAIGNWGGDVVVNLTADNLPVTLGTHMKYWGDVFAQKSPFAPLLAPEPKKNPFTVATRAGAGSTVPMNPVAAGGGNAASAVALPMLGSTATMTTSALAMHSHINAAPTSVAGLADTFDPSAPVLGASVQSSIAVAYPGAALLEKTLTISLPDKGITLALYAVVVADNSGNPFTVGYNIRYSRTANIWATQSDLMLTRYDPEKLA